MEPKNDNENTDATDGAREAVDKRKPTRKNSCGHLLHLPRVRLMRLTVQALAPLARVNLITNNMSRSKQNTNSTGGPAVAQPRFVRPRAGDTWRFPMFAQLSSGRERKVWWTRKITFINDGWAHWENRNSNQRDQTLISTIMEGALISRQN